MSKQFKILHLDHSSEYRNTLTRLLTSKIDSLDILSVADIKGFNSALINKRFDLLVCSTSIPGSDAFQILGAANSAGVDTPMVFLGEPLDMETSVCLIKAGAENLYTKGNESALASYISELLQTPGAQRDLYSQMTTVISGIPGAVYRFRRTAPYQYELIYVNPGFKRIFDIDDRDPINSIESIFASITEPDMDIFVSKIEKSADLCEPWHEEFRIETSSGNSKWIRGHSIPVTQKDGTTIWNGLLTDITREKYLSSKIEKQYHDAVTHSTQTEARMRAILDTVVDPIITCDQTGTIKSCTPSVLNVFGYLPDELINSNLRILMTDEFHDKHHEDLHNFFVHDDKTILDSFRELDAKRKNGETIVIELAVSSFELDGTRMFTGICRDISSRKLMEESLRTSEERFRISQMYADIGSWDWNIKTGDLYWSDRIGPLFGYADKVPETTYENFINAVYPDDRDALVKAVNDAVEHNKEYNIEHRVLCQDGSIRWVLEKGAVTRGENGEPLHMLGVVSDIDARKRLEVQISKQNDLLQLNQDALTRFMSGDKDDIASSSLLKRLMSLTGSTIGALIEVNTLIDGNRRYTIDSVIDRNSGNTYSLKQGSESRDNQLLLNLHGIENLIGQSLECGNPVLVNNPDAIAESGIRIDADIRNIASIPVFFGTDMVGVYCLANADNGFDSDFPEFMSPFTLTYGTIINARRSRLLQKRTRQALIDAKDDAEKANKAKSDFLSSMSHELRTPLNAIIGFGQLLEMDMDNILSPTYKENVDEILKAGDHLLGLIDEVLELTKIEAGKLSLSFEPIDFPDLLRECFSLIAPMASSHHVTVSTPDFINSSFFVMADRMRLKQILLNLFSNAIKYNIEDGNMSVSASQLQEGYWRIGITDTGIGIPENRISELFTSFNRLGKEASDIEGTGIGLVITKRLIELMSGRINVESTPGKGSTFWVDIPLAKDAAIRNFYPSGSDAASKKPRDSDEKQHEILYIEDNPANLKLVSKVLAPYSNINFHAVRDPIIGLDIARNKSLDIILLDINIPNMDGFQVLEQLKKHERTRDIPVIAISANAMPDDIQRGYAAGFDAYLPKPLNIPEFISTVESYLRAGSNRSEIAASRNRK
ncbi:MAG: PAS domain S-box protein [Gammaproteobacteria bacterium]|nr:PAS domain S-box protein [Gammaproteobacteria bacterium]